MRVPLETLMWLKFVSRQWHSLITAPHFRNLLPPLRVSGLFFQRTKVLFVHRDDPNTPSPFKSLAFVHDPCDPERICIVQSCNGLLLCSTDDHALVAINKRNHYVYNPFTNQVDTLPKHPCHNKYGLPSINLIFDPSKSPHYKVIAFLAKPQSDVGDFFICSSETGSWRASIQAYLPSPDMWFRYGVYWNGCLHWLGQYSRPVSDSLYFNVDEESALHYTEVRPSVHSAFSVYEMKSDYSEWFVKYQIDLVPISIAFPEMKDCSFFPFESCYNAAVASIIRRENFKEDSFLVLVLPGKIIHYNLIDKSFKVIWDFVVDLELQGNLRHWLCGNFKAWPYKPLRANVG
ncbi:F-box domain-containing protein [Heracleum sosnowskyi]|uniref:F-box domain-containing protein n=1 Tax=Heracleum sosnowskyi TaxID=360622 RepID=A0AAD8H9H9_9APIA|nr:F-box domain-containing protein [Heracleum sosnowskyi]